MHHIQVAWPYFSSAVQPLVPTGNPAAPSLTPRLDLLESAREVVCIFEIPGAKPEEINVEVVDQQLAVSGVTSAGLPEGERDLAYRYRERVEGRFHRLIPLPARVDTTMAMANYKEGLLTVRLPKAEPTAQAPRRITVSKLD
ncbi:MAG: Hsp20/alpha crystallin family protein [Clostridia bacterium]|nr:Hsp20/alpha crystallin family protein [Clostridia bacterium]